MKSVRIGGLSSSRRRKLGAAALAVGGICLGTGGCAGTHPRGVEASAPLNATYRIEGWDVRLIDGRAERESAQGSAARIRTRVAGKVVFGDLDRDGDPDAGVILAVDDPGSGTFYYVAAARNDANSFTGTAPAVNLGDRVVVTKTQIRKGVIVVDYLDRRPGEPMTTPPTVPMTIQVTPKGDKLSVQGPFASPDAGANTQAPLLPRISGGEWRLARLKIEGREYAIAPEKRPTLKIDPSGKVAGLASVNRYFGDMTVGAGGQVVWGGPLGSTMTAGPQPLMEQEQTFLKALQTTDRLSLREDHLVLEDAAGKTELEFER